MRNIEENLTIACNNWFRMQYPKVLASHIPSGGQRHVAIGAKLKRMGTIKGLPDFMVFERIGNRAGLAIELKVGKNKPSPEQIDVLQRLEKNGWVVSVCYSFDEFEKVVNEYFNNKL
jgi:hypothetical protein